MSFFLSRSSLDVGSRERRTSDLNIQLLVHTTPFFGLSPQQNPCARPSRHAHARVSPSQPPRAPSPPPTTSLTHVSLVVRVHRALWRARSPSRPWDTPFSLVRRVASAARALVWTRDLLARPPATRRRGTRDPPPRARRARFSSPPGLVRVLIARLSPATARTRARTRGPSKKPRARRSRFRRNSNAFFFDDLTGCFPPTRRRVRTQDDFQLA